jgi:hypothetical protein
MGSIVDFPKKRYPNTSSDLQVEKMEPNSAKTGKIDFTCVTCQNTTQIEMTNAVLKEVELFCSKCGTGWRLTNPVFAKKQKRTT